MNGAEEDEAGEAPSKIPVVKSADRVLDVLEFLASEGPRTFSQIAAALGIPKSSLSHLLRNLTARGYLNVAANTGFFSLGKKLAEIAGRSLAATPFAIVLRRDLANLRDESNETSAFYIQRLDEAEVFESFRSRQSLVYMISVGDRVPLYAHSAGKIILANMADDAFDAYLERVELRRLTPKTIQSKSALKMEIARARTEGLAFAFEEFSVGIKGIAAPVAIQGRFFGSLNLAVPSARYSPRFEAFARSRLPRLAASLAESALAGGFTPPGASPPSHEPGGDRRAKALF